MGPQSCTLNSGVICYRFKKAVLGTTGYDQLRLYTAVHLAFNHAMNF